MGQIIWRHLNSYLVTGQDLDKVHSELAGNVRQNGVPVANVNGKHCIRQCIDNDALKFNYVVFAKLKPPLVLTVDFLAARSQIPS